MAIVVGRFKFRVGKSGQSGLHHRQFADSCVIIGERCGADLAKARPSLAFNRADMPAAAGRRQKRVTQIASEGRAKRGDRRENHIARFQLYDSQMVVNIDRKPMISGAFEELVNL